MDVFADVPLARQQRRPGVNTHPDRQPEPVLRVAGSGKRARVGESAGERDPRATTPKALREYGPFVEPVRGADFERGRTEGRRLSVDEAVQYALSGLDSPR